MTNWFHSGKLFRLLGGLLICVAVGWTVYNLYDDYRYNQANQTIYQELKEVQSTPDSEVDLSDFTFREMPIREIDGVEYIGTLQIPSLNISTGVINELTMPNLKISVCRYVGSVYEDNMVLAGHNYQTCFGKLGNLDIGDTVIFTDNDGNVFTYEVSDVEQLQPTQIEEMVTSEDWDLTLFSCLYNGASRIAIRCTKME